MAAQSGAKWGFALLPLQIVLIPVLYLTQELTVRLGIHMKQGHTACIRDYFGPCWAWLSALLLVISCTGAIVSEISAIASVLELWGSSRWMGALISALSIVSAVVLLNYRQVEAFGIAMGLFELTFVITMFASKPSPSKMIASMSETHTQAAYWEIFSSNIGAVIMPWMIYFQQSAVVARRLTSQSDLIQERAMTFCGSCLTQLVMIGALVTLAAGPRASQDLKSVRDIHTAFTPMFGEVLSLVLVTLGFIGSSLCGAVVVSLTAAWAICEAANWEDPFSLDRRITEAPRFYAVFLFIVFAGVVVHLIGINVIRLNVYIELIDSFLLPMALSFLFLLVTRQILPQEVRVHGYHRMILGVSFAVVSLTGLSTGIYGILE